MADKDQSSSRELTIEQQEAIAGANSWVEDSAAQLGLAYLEYQEAENRFRLAEKNLASMAVSTRDAEAQRSQVMAKFAELLELGPGQWMYDGKSKLVKKDKPDAKST